MRAVFLFLLWRLRKGSFIRWGKGLFKRKKNKEVQKTSEEDNVFAKPDFSKPISFEEIITATAEFDDEHIIYSKLDEHTFVFEGNTPLEDFYKIIKLGDPSAFELQKGKAETLADFLLQLLPKLPQKKDVIDFYDYSFTIEVVDEVKIRQIKFSRGIE